MARPDYEDVMAEVERVAASAGSVCTVKMLGRSVEGRDIPCLLFTDPGVPSQTKQRVMVIAGQHGSEESGRAIALELMSFLASGEAEVPDILRSHEVAVVPCANPDGAVKDTYRNANDVDVAHTFQIDGPAGTPEGRALEAFALEFAPEVFVDIHGLGGGSMKDRVWFSKPLWFTPDRYFLAVMGMEMTRAVEAEGFPQCEAIPPIPFRPGEPWGDDLRLGEKLAVEVKSLSFGLEAIEHYYREPDWRKEGIARLRRLFRFGMEDYFGLGESGYPSSLISGTRICGLKAHGATPAERRESRVALTRFLRHNFALVDRDSDGLVKCARVKVVSQTLEGPNPGRFAVILRLRKPAKVLSVEWDGQALAEGDEHGYRIWDDAISVLVQVNLKAPFGGSERYLVVRYDSPYLS